MLPVVMERKERALREAERPVMVRAFRTICWAEEVRVMTEVVMEVWRVVEMVEARDGGGSVDGRGASLVVDLLGGRNGVETDSVEAVEARISGWLTTIGAESLILASIDEADVCGSKNIVGVGYGAGEMPACLNRPESSYTARSVRGSQAVVIRSVTINGTSSTLQNSFQKANLRQLRDDQAAASPL